MKPFIPFLLTFLLLASSAYATEQRQLLDRVVAVVNDDAITQSELDVLLRPIYEQLTQELHGQQLIETLNEARQKLLNQLIEDRLAFSEAKRIGVEIDETQIEQQIQAFRQRFPNEAALEDALKEEGITLHDLEERLKRQAMIRSLHDHEIRSRVVVSPTEIEQYFESHKSEFSSQEAIQVRSLTIKKSAEARQKGLTDEVARDKILEFKNKIEAGEKFDEIAKSYSEDAQAENGGLSEWLHRGNMIEVIDDVIFGLKAGEMSDIIETPMGYHLFRLEERKEGKQRTLEEARDEIYSLIFRDKADLRFQEWMKELKRNAYISIR